MPPFFPSWLQGNVLFIFLNQELFSTDAGMMVQEPKVDTVDGRNPANQLRLVVNPIIYSFYIPGGAGVLPSTVRLGETRIDLIDIQFTCNSPVTIVIYSDFASVFGLIPHLTM